MLEADAPEPHAMLLVSERPMDLEGFHLVHVSPSMFHPEQALGRKAVLIDAGAPAVVSELCRRLRQHPLPTIYLTPVFLLEREGGLMSKAISHAVDGTATPASFFNLYQQRFSDRIVAIHQRLSRLVRGSEDQDTNLALKFLRYLYVRGAVARPMHDLMTLRGYHYPDLDLFLGQADDNAFELLKFLEDHRLVTGEFVDKIHLCGACGSAFLNFRETCSHCHSANLRMEDLVHHFRCAHVAPLEEFQQNGGLRCPKCHHELKQIGVDYDKPSSVYICRECDHSTQEPDTSTLCFRCGMESIPERLGVHTVKAYSLTGLAENAAIHGLDNLFRSILEGELDILPLAVFRRFVNVEIERMKRYKLSRSSLVILHVQDLDRIYLEAGPRAKEIFSEFARIIHAALRPSDVITAFNDSLFLILATETGSDGATGMASRLTERLDGLVRSNFDHPALIKSHGMELSGHSSGDALIDQLIRQYLP